MLMNSISNAPRRDLCVDIFLMTFRIRDDAGQYQKLN